MSASRARYFVLILALGLGGCLFEKSPEDLNTLIEKGNPTEALNDIEDQLSKQPNSPVYQILALKARLARCVAMNCTATHPADMQSIAASLKALKGPVNISEKLTLDPQVILSKAAEEFAQLPDQPTPLLSLLSVTPDANKSHVADAVFTLPLMQLRAGAVASATATLQGFTRSNALSPVYRQWGGAMGSLLSRNVSLTESNLLGLRSMVAGTPLPATGLRLVPHVLFATTTSGTRAFLTEFSSTLAGWKLPPSLLGPLAQRPIAQEVNFLRTAEPFLTRALANWAPGTGTGTVVTGLSPTVPLTDPGVALQLHLTALSLEMDPTQSQLWQQFLPLASQYIEKTGDPDLFTGLSLTALPTTQQQQVVTDLFQLIQRQAKANQPILPLLQQLSQLQLERGTATKLEKLVQSGLEGAITNQNLDEVLAYARFKPELARVNRTGIVPLVAGAIRDDLRQEKFDEALTLSKLLNETLGIDFNLDTLLIKEFQDQTTRTKVADALSSETSSWLTQPSATVVVDLGPLWSFMQTHFAAQPKVLNDVLRDLVNTAHGAWGTPTAVYRLYGNFDDRDFPPADRHAYLVSAIATSLVEDTALSPEERLTTAARLKQQFPELALAPVVETALKDCKTLDDSRALWQQSPQTVREVITAVRPQFAALMRGVDAWQSGDRNAAAKAFAIITDATYTSQLSPYLLEIGSQLSQVEGLYANLNGSQTGGGNLPTLALRVTVPAFATPAEASQLPPLTQLNLSVLNRLGSLVTTSPASGPNALTTSYGTLRLATLPVTLNLNKQQAPIPQVALQRATAPAAFETTYGNLKTLTFTSSSIIVTTAANPEPVRLTQLLVSASAVLWPNGRYSLTSPVAQNIPGEGAASLKNLLPPGSLLTLTADATLPNPDNTYPVTGELWHPGLSQPQAISGTFNPQLLMTDLTWNAPLPSGGLVKAVGRCQTVPSRIICGAHYAHLARQQFAWQISGAQTAESLAQTRDDLARRNQDLLTGKPAAGALLNRLENVPLEFVSRTLPAATLSTTGPVTPTTTLSPTTAAPAAATPAAAPQSLLAPASKGEILPPPSFNAIPSGQPLPTSSSPTSPGTR